MPRDMNVAVLVWLACYHFSDHFVHSFAHKTAQVNRPTKLIITIAYIFRGFCAATDSLCIFAFFGYDTPPPGCDYRAPTGPGPHVNGSGRAEILSGRAGPGRGISARADLY